MRHTLHVLCLLPTLCACHSLLAVEAAAAATVEVRMLGRHSQVLLMRDGRPVALAEVRPATATPPALLTAQQLKAKLEEPGETRILDNGDSQIREQSIVLKTGHTADALNVALYVKRVADGARLMISGTVCGPSSEDLSPEERLAAPPPLELALQILPDAEGQLPKLTVLDAGRQNVEPEPRALCCSSFVLEGAKGLRLNIARSGPTDWTWRNHTESLLITSALKQHPRETGNIGSFLLYFGCGADTAAPEMSPLVLDKANSATYEMVEGAVRVYASGANPFSLSDVSVIAEVALPPRADGEVPLKRLPCFFWEDADGGKAEGEFRFRFTPPAEGLYGVRIVVVAPTGQVRGSALPLRASAPLHPGFVRVRKGERIFRLDNGRAFFPIGAALDSGLELAQLNSAFRALIQQGANTVRLFPSIQLEHAKAGVFDAALAEKLDQILRAAQARGIFVVLPIESGAALGKHSQHHPYFREMGGPLAATPEFFRSPAVRKLFQNRLAYVAARYSAFRAVLSWELLSDVETSWSALQDDPDDPKLQAAQADLARRARRDVQEWCEQMALYLNGMDPHRHLTCASTRFAPNKAWRDLERLENLDWIFSAQPTEKDRDPILGLVNWAQNAREPGRPHRPLLLAQAPEYTGDPLDAAFASLALGFAGPPLQALAAEGELARLKPPALFAAGLSEVWRWQGKEELLRVCQEVQPPKGPPVRVLGQTGRRGMALWLQHADSQKPDEIQGVQLTLAPLTEGAYRVVWLNTRTGQIVAQERYNAPAKKIDQPPAPTLIRAPAFTRDIALIITPEERPSKAQ